MKHWLSFVLLAAGLVAWMGWNFPAASQPQPNQQPVPPLHAERNPTGGETSPAQEQAMWQDIQRGIAMLRQEGGLAPFPSTATVTYAFPLRMAAGRTDAAGFRVSAFPDHQTASGAVLDYYGGTRTYDGHRGTDYGLFPFSWNKVDAGDVQVIAAAAGTIVAAANVDPTDHNCGGSSNDPWNYVALVHADGRMTVYGHLRYNSLTPKGVGQTVAQGEILGEVASSGNSSGPHLHFEVRYGGFSTLEWVDPYAGPHSQAQSLWAEQRPYFDSAINRLGTHSAPPSSPDPCLPAVTHLQDKFTPPGNIYFYAYYRDYQSALTTQLKIFRPDGSLYRAWSYAPSAPAFASAWNQGWVYAFSSSDPVGFWRFEATYNNQTVTTIFQIQPQFQLAARDDYALTALNMPKVINVLGNDMVASGSTATITALGVPLHGAVGMTAGQVLYTPAPDQIGQDQFTYTISLGAEQAVATVTVWVTATLHRSFLPLTQR